MRPDVPRFSARDCHLPDFDDRPTRLNICGMNANSRDKPRNGFAEPAILP
jgi:hypothetical protein